MSLLSTSVPPGFDTLLVHVTSHCILVRIPTCTVKKRVLFGTHDPDCDSTQAGPHDVTTLSLTVVTFTMLGSM